MKNLSSATCINVFQERTRSRIRCLIFRQSPTIGCRLPASLVWLLAVQEAAMYRRILLLVVLSFSLGACVPYSYGDGGSYYSSEVYSSPAPAYYSGGGSYYSAPRYYQPAPRYYQPAPRYYSAPRYYQAQPRYYQSHNRGWQGHDRGGWDGRNRGNWDNSRGHDGRDHRGGRGDGRDGRGGHR